MIVLMGLKQQKMKWILFEKIKGLHKSLVIFNDGPVDLENDEYTIYNNYSVEQKLEVMDKALVAGILGMQTDDERIRFFP